ncbi:MAG: TrbI/VirB10 family protein [Acidobacteria bacterium]|nr:TrbI/VirB10 family protein [Acidobacteriota bacterium]
MRSMILAVSSIAMAVAMAAQAGTITLPAGTKLHVVLEKTLSTKETKAGDPFTSRLVMPVWVNQREVLPVGTMVEGSVVNLQGPGRVSGRAEMQLRPEKLIFPDGRDYTLAATLESAKTGDDTKVDPREGTVKAGGKDGINARKAAGGAAIGAIAGAAVHGGTGAAMGAGAVGAIVLLHHLFKRGKDAVLPAGSELDLELTRPVSFSDMQEVPPSSTPAPQSTQKPDEKQ